MDLDKVKHIIDKLNQAQVIDSILTTMDNGFGEVTFKITIQNGAIKVIALTDTKTIKLE